MPTPWFFASASEPRTKRKGGGSGMVQRAGGDEFGGEGQVGEAQPVGKGFGGRLAMVSLGVGITMGRAAQILGRRLGRLFGGEERNS